jgi:hypothetical protein
MRLWPLFPAPFLYPSDCARQHPRRAGMARLRHKPRFPSGSNKVTLPYFLQRHEEASTLDAVLALVQISPPCLK